MRVLAADEQLGYFAERVALEEGGADSVEDHGVTLAALFCGAALLAAARPERARALSPPEHGLTGLISLTRLVSKL